MWKNQANDKKNVKRILILLSLIALMFTIYKISQIYALFYTQGKGSINQEIAKWVIVINEKNIVSEQIEEFNLGNFNIIGINTSNDKFTPGMSGYFEMEIDPKNTQVSIRYDIIIDNEEAEENNIFLVEIIETEANNTIVRTGENTYTGIIPFTVIDGNYINNIKLTFKWEEDTSGEEIVLPEILSVKIPMQVKVTQYLGEQIKEYEEE